MESKMSELLLFLFENDSFRFQVQMSLQMEPLRIQALSRQLDNVYTNREYDIHIQVINDLMNYGINVPASFSCLCSFVWRDFLDRGQRIHRSNVWTSFRKKILEDIEIDFNAVIGDDHHYVYFNQYLTQSKGDMACLLCWRDIRHVTSALDLLKKQESLLHHGIRSIDEFIMDPYDSLDILIECVRKLHGVIIRGVCTGLSQNTKIKLAESFQKTASIRHVKSVDKTFARDCCEMLENLLRALQTECCAHLEELFVSFRESKEYHALVASVRLSQSMAVQEYLRNNAFLQHVRDGKILPWRLTGQVLFATYHQETQRLHRLSVRRNKADRSEVAESCGDKPSIHGPMDTCQDKETEQVHMATEHIRKLCGLRSCSGSNDEKACDVFLCIAIRRDSIVIDECGFSSVVKGPDTPRSVESENCRSGIETSPVNYLSSGVHTSCWVGMMPSRNISQVTSEDLSNAIKTCSCGLSSAPAGYSVSMKLACCSMNESLSASHTDTADTNMSRSSNRPQQTSPWIRRLDVLLDKLVGVHDNERRERNVSGEMGHASPGGQLHEVSGAGPSYSPITEVTTDKELVGSFHALMDILHVQDDQETTHASSYESRDTEYILHMARVENEREIVDVGGVGCQVDSRVVVLSLFPVPAAISAIAKSLATRHLLCSNATPNFHGNGDCALTGSICPDCLCIPDDFHVSLLPLEYDALKFNGMAYEIMHSSVPSVQHERLVELYVNPPLGSGSRVGRVFPDISLLEVVRGVSPILMALMMTRVLGNRAVTNAITALRCLLQPFHAISYDIFQFSSDLSSYGQWKSNPFLTSSDRRASFMLGLPSDLAVLIMQCQMDPELLPHLFAEEGGDDMDTSYSKLHWRQKTMIDFGSYDMNDVTFIDIDNDKIWTNWNPAGSSAVEEVLRVLPSQIVERLHVNINTIESDFIVCSSEGHQATKTSFLHLSVPVAPGCEPSILSLYNQLVADEFTKILNDIFMGNIPSSLRHYPDMQIVACDVKELFSGSASLRHQSSHDIHLMISTRAEIASLYQHRVDFLEALVDSPSFLFLLRRHGAALDTNIALGRSKVHRATPSSSSP